MVFINKPRSHRKHGVFKANTHQPHGRLMFLYLHALILVHGHVSAHMRVIKLITALKVCLVSNSNIFQVSMVELYCLYHSVAVSRFEHRQQSQRVLHTHTHLQRHKFIQNVTGDGASTSAARV